MIFDLLFFKSNFNFLSAKSRMKFLNAISEIVRIIPSFLFNFQICIDILNLMNSDLFFENTFYGLTNLFETISSGNASLFTTPFSHGESSLKFSTYFFIKVLKFCTDMADIEAKSVSVNIFSQHFLSFWWLFIRRNLVGFVDEFSFLGQPRKRLFSMYFGGYRHLG